MAIAKNATPAAMELKNDFATLFLHETLQHLRSLKDISSLSDLEYFMFDPLYLEETKCGTRTGRKRKAASAANTADDSDSDSEAPAASIQRLLDGVAATGAFLTDAEAIALRQAGGVGSQSALLELFNGGECGPGGALADACRPRRAVDSAEAAPPSPVNRAVPGGPRQRTLRLLGGEYAVPAGSGFALSQLSSAAPLLRQLSLSDGPYDVIIVDPPWPNASAKRRGVYAAVDATGVELMRLPVSELLRPAAAAAAGDGPGPLVLVWCTNSARHQCCVLEELTAAWGLRLLGRWLWAKVTATGQPLVPLRSRFRRPYEPLYVLGRRQQSYTTTTTAAVPTELTMLSVPSCLHSKKPCLKPLLNAILGTDQYRCLELFARNLTPGWSSWGNEVLKHQHLDFQPPAVVAWAKGLASTEDDGD